VYLLHNCWIWQSATLEARTPLGDIFECGPRALRRPLHGGKAQLSALSTRARLAYHCGAFDVIGDRLGGRARKSAGPPFRFPGKGQALQNATMAFCSADALG